MKKISNAGFTLLELSIVLVIIGLIVGSVLVGQDLITAARMRAINKEITAYQAAFMTFTSKYGALPGDIRTPGALFPEQIWLGGNQDGAIIWTGEGAEAWRQLSLAQMIPGVKNTTCSANCVADPNDPGGTIPRSQAFTNAGWTIMYSALTQKNVLLYGARSTGFIASNPVLTPHQAWDIDMKFDNGIATTGSVIATNTVGFADCANGLGAYNVLTKTPVCNFSINLGK